MMTRWLLAAALACGGPLGAFPSPAAQAQPAPASATAPTTAPTEAQVDKLLETLDMRRTLEEMFAQMNTFGDTVGEQMLGPNATPEQREALKRVMTRQQGAMRDAMSWERMAPIYRRVYAKLFTADEVNAMIAFYGSDAGRGIMRKMPQAMQITMEEMGPIMQEMMTDLRESLEAEVERQTNADASSAH